MNLDMPVEAYANYESKIVKTSYCWIWQGAIASGYGTHYTGFGMRQAHRLAYYQFYEEDPKEKHVLHRCDNTLCVNPEHLFLGTPADNVADCKSKNRHAHGEKHTNSKISNLQVKQIRLMYGLGISQKEISRKFPISQQQISRIVNYERWDN